MDDEPEPRPAATPPEGAGSGPDAPTPPAASARTSAAVPAPVPAAPTSERDRMPAWVPRALVLFFVALAGYRLITWAVLELESLLMVLLVSLFLSFALEPAVNSLARRGMRRGVATGLVMVGLFLAVAAFLGILGQALFTQVSDFAEELPDRLEKLEQDLNHRFDTELDFDELIESVRDKNLGDSADKVASNALDLGMTAVGVVFQLFTIALFTFYMVAEGPKFRRTVLSFLRPERQEQVAEGWEIAIDKTGGYIYSRGLLALLSAIATTIFLQVMGVPYAFALGVWTGLVSQFIPTIGTYLAGALPVLIGALEDPMLGVWVLVFVTVYQQVENYVFAPKITARTMEMHPAVAFGTVLVGSALFDSVGALLAIPAAALIQAIGSTYFERHDVIERDLTREPERRRLLRRRAAVSPPPDPPG